MDVLSWLKSLPAIVWVIVAAVVLAAWLPRIIQALMARRKPPVHDPWETIDTDRRDWGKDQWEE